MILVDRPTLFPSMTMFGKKHDRRCIDTLIDFDWEHDGRIYMDIETVQEMARLIGYGPSEELQERITDLEERNRELEEECQSLRDLEKTIAYAGEKWERKRAARAA